MTNTSGKILLTDAPEKLKTARSIATNVPYELHDFCEYLSDFSEDNITPEELLLLIKKVLTKEHIVRKRNTAEELTEGIALRCIIYLSYFPRIIDKLSTPEFSLEFRKLFTKNFGAPQQMVAEKEEFGVIIVEDGIVDISNKNKAEVLAALYNNSHPHGLGFMQARSDDMTIEQAEELLKESTYFDYLHGRVMKIDLSTNLVYTRGYNRDNGNGAAEKAISQCHNI